MLYADHSRTFARNKYVYAVLSRRSRGISIGINLNPDRVCNFDCIYCQVDRTSYVPQLKVDIKCISTELKETIDSVISGRLYSIEPFDKIPIELRHLSDIALSGDAEPTTFTNFYEVVEEIIKVKQDETRLVLITNASCLNRLKVQDAVDLMYRYNGEVWAKLDAGSEDFFRKISRSNIEYSDILGNIILTSRKHPVVIQSCFCRIEGTPPPPDEITLYCKRLKEIVDHGGRIRLVQLYTVARPPAEKYVTPLTEGELDSIALEVRETTGLTAEIFP
ncbi:MAG: radical SAM protein [Nitrospirae bacterium]|nr:radical SAM protein [Nitrospirota bacterium]